MSNDDSAMLDLADEYAGKIQNVSEFIFALANQGVFRTLHDNPYFISEVRRAAHQIEHACNEFDQHKEQMGQAVVYHLQHSQTI